MLAVLLAPVDNFANKLAKHYLRADLLGVYVNELHFQFDLLAPHVLQKQKKAQNQ